MFLLGLMMRGALFQPQTGDLLTTVIYCGGFIGEPDVGIAVFPGRVAGLQRSRTSPGHVHDYGTKFLVAAGLLNMLAMVDAFEIATGKEGLDAEDESFAFRSVDAVRAVFTSVVLGIITKRTDRERLRYAAYCFACFMAAIFGLSWLMYLGHG